MGQSQGARPPARALQAWLDFRHGGGDRTASASDAALPVFVGLSKAGKLSAAALSDKAVWRLVKQATRDAGLANPEGYSGHSLRAGLATAAGEAGADLAAVMRQTRQHSAEVALSYLRPAELWRNNASQKVWDKAWEKPEEAGWRQSSHPGFKNNAIRSSVRKKTVCAPQGSGLSAGRQIAFLNAAAITYRH